ncbi:major facilitator superfamily domain-containing protein [Cladochytrium replicatum]|nr:major facilitator superfamily domain-containing protein [Cladochytrium replicatum]
MAPFADFYSKPVVQVALVGFVCFLCPGMFNAISGIGGGGQVDPNAANSSNVALYAAFSLVSFFSGTINSMLGPRLTLGLGAIGYCLYIASFLSYNISPETSGGFVIAAGAILGVCASMLWTAQGSLMLAYPTEGSKGKYISLFWVIFNLGAVIGSAIQLALTFNQTANSLDNSVYIGFVVLTGIGALIPALLKNPATMVRTDGTKVVVPKGTSWIQEFRGLFKLLRSDPWVILLFPLFFASNFFYTWQFNDFNSPLFTLRTRSLNNLVYWLAQMVGSYFIGLLLDSKSYSRRTRAWIGWVIVFVVNFAVWGGSYAKQTTYTREDVKLGKLVRVDFTDSSYAALCFLYIFSGAMDAILQNLVYWLIGATSNDLTKLGYLTGFYKSIQSAGGAIAYAMDRDEHPYMTNLVTTWCICVGGLLIALPVLYSRITDHTVEDAEKTLAATDPEYDAVATEVVLHDSTKAV